MRNKHHINLGEVTDRLRYGGRLRHWEAQKLKTRLATPHKEEDIHHLSIAFSLGVRPYRSNMRLVEKYLNPNVDPHDVAGAIIALCDNWRKAHKYKEFLLLICNEKCFDRTYDAAKAAFIIFEKNIQKPNFTDAFEILFWRWQEILNPEEGKRISPHYAQCINRVMEVALFGNKVFEPFYFRIGQNPNPEWEAPLSEILTTRKISFEKAKNKFNIFEKIF